MTAQREIRQGRFMTDSETMMWRAEQDPLLSSGMGSIMLLDQAPDTERLVDTMEIASRTLLRLRERVEDGSGIAPPRWVIDDQFDINDHVRSARLPGKGGMRELLDLAAQVFEDPFDRAKPLWQFVAVEGRGGRARDAVKGAVIIKLHHSVSDGIGAVRLGEMYFDLERDPPARTAPEAPRSDDDHGLRGEIEYVARQQFDAVRKAAGEVALWGADPGRIRRAAEQATSTVRAVANQLGGSPPSGSGSDLWGERSRHRSLEVFDLDLEELKAGAKRRGGTVNDLFVAGTVLAAARFHAGRASEATGFNLSFIMSMRNDDAAGGNAFMPVPFSIPASSTNASEVFDQVSAAMAAKREVLGRPGSGNPMELLAGVANLLPTPMLTRVGRARTANLDWATSNIRGIPFPLFMAGAEVLHMYPIGPLGGTAFNLTAISYNGGIDFGLFLDPRSVTEQDALRAELEQAYADLLA